MNKKEKKMVIFALLLGNVMTGLDGTITNTAIPAIISALHGVQFMGWIVATYLLGMSVSIPIWTKIGERISYKKAFQLAILFFTLGSFFQAIAPNIYFFLIARLMMGIGGGGMGSLPYIIVGYMYENLEKRSQALGYLVATYNGAMIVGPLIGGALIDSLSWRWVFYINIPIGILTFVISYIYYKPIEQLILKKFDILGAILLSIGLIMFLTGIQLIGLVSNGLAGSLIIASLIIIGIFVFVEKRAVNPIIPLSIFRNKKLDIDFILFALAWGAFVAINTYMPMWAQALLGMSALIGGMTLIPNSVVEILASQVVAPIQEKLGSFKLITIGILSEIISVGGMFFANLKTPLWLLVTLTAVSGIGVAFIFIALQVKVQVDATEENMSIATSTSYLVRILAQTLMAAVYGIVMNLVLAAGVANNSKITFKMMNKLSDAAAAKTLPQSLLPTMRAIFHQGIRIISLVSLILLITALIINIFYSRKEKM